MKPWGKVLFGVIVAGLVACNEEPEYYPNVAKPAVKEQQKEITLSLHLPEDVVEGCEFPVKIGVEEGHLLQIKVHYRTNHTKKWKIKKLRRVDGFYSANIPGQVVETVGVELFFTYRQDSGPIRFFYATSDNPALLTVSKYEVQEKENPVEVEKNPEEKAEKKKPVYKLRTIKRSVKIGKKIQKKDTDNINNIKPQEKAPGVKEAEEPVEPKEIETTAEAPSEKPDISGETYPSVPVVALKKDEKAVKSEPVAKTGMVEKVSVQIEVSPEIFNDAAYSGDVERLSYCLKKGMNPDTRDGKGRIPLINASNRGHDDVVRMLLKAGATVDIRDDKGYTPLLKAVMRKRISTARILWNYGANPEAQNKQGISPISYSRRRGLTKLTAFLDSRKSVAEKKPGNALNAEVKSGDSKKSPESQLLEKIKKLGLKPDGESLAQCARRGYVDKLKLLLDYGVKPGSKDKKGTPALIHAVNRANLESIRLLIARGADINTRDAKGNTPLIKAVFRKNESLVKFLIAKGADRGAKNYRGMDAVTYAEKKKLHKIVKLLKSY